MPEEGSIPITWLSLSLAQDAHRVNTRILNQKAVTIQAVIAVFTLGRRIVCQGLRGSDSEAQSWDNSSSRRFSHESEPLMSSP